MTPDHSAGAAVGYFLIIGMVSTAIQIFWQLTIGSWLEPLDGRFGIFFGGAMDQAPLLSLLFAPLILLISLGIVAVALHVTLWITGGAKEGLGTTTRVLCYAYGPQLFGIVPVLGSVVGALWMIGTAIIGLREAHRTTTTRAAIAVLVPFVGLVVLFALLVLAVAAAGGRMLQI